MSHDDLQRTLVRLFSDPRCRSLSSQTMAVSLGGVDYYVLLLRKSEAVPGAANDDLDRPWMRPFLDHLRHGLPLQTAAELAGVHRDTVYKSLRRCAAFRKACDTVRRVELIDRDSTAASTVNGKPVSSVGLGD